MKLISQIGRIFIMCMVLSGIMKNTILYTIYEYDKASFIAMYCKNKDRPQLKCNGKCKLAKMQQEENEKNTANALKQLQSEVICFYPLRTTPFSDKEHCFFILPTNGIVTDTQLYSFIYVSKLVKPPETYLG
ncbi:hypothetical protein ACFFI0_10450 [Olivibacter oleidegradans]|uniref:Uncharacterized protein n=2 Tax=Sphingobacteriaceae TaxID=84566 RepID=A0ABV6HLA2_9SPHI|nr:hypothetical protein [Olivibacter sp. 47]